MNELLLRVANIYVEQFEWDVSWMCQPWMYIPLGIPAVLYCAFMFIKWVFLTAPLWIPLRMVMIGFVHQQVEINRRRAKNQKPDDDGKNFAEYR